ncbi:hypothetical protein AZ019_001161 [Klebsiella pneumoniae]|uniref:DUF551 domain-containing protein n=1 Tax=Klebsiella pneumoniae TaxID=573 RepID=UPI000B62C371|nr:DUF551 domain-containing protein [Klebsiella pneumoniae]OUH40266.1 hypothetical protein AZ019_001161 [Klebsiella pneumoniae]
MTKSTITREQAQKIIVAADEVITALAGTNEDVHPDDSKKMCELWDDLNDRHAPPVVVRELARMALAAMDSEPVAWRRFQETPNDGGYWILYDYRPNCSGVEPLYRHAQPAVVSEKIIDNFEEEFRRAFEVSAAVEQLIEIGYQGDKFSLSIRDAATLWKLGRAAMLQTGNSPAIPDGWTCNDKANAALMMLDRIETADPVDDDRIDGIKRIVRELVAAKQPQNAPQNIPEIIPGWIPVSERMPEDDDFVYIWPRPDFGVELHVGQYCECSPKGDGWYAQVYEQNYGIEWHPITVTHWMPLPAAPQEVKSES